MKSNDNSGSVRPFGFRAPRVSTNFGFSLEVIATGERFEAVCTDISEDGLAADLLGSLAPKTQVRLRLLLPGATVPLQMDGSVEYCEDERCGLNFLPSSADERNQLREFIRSVE